MSRKGSSNGEYDSSVADKIMKQLQKDSEELTLSLEGFINTRGHAIYSQKLALAAYDDEIAAIVDTESDEKYVYDLILFSLLCLSDLYKNILYTRLSEFKQMKLRWITTSCAI